MARPTRRDVLVALSLANLCFVRVWGTLVPNPNDYYKAEPSSTLAWISAWGSVVALGCLFLLGNRWLQRRNLIFLRQSSFFVVACVALNGLRQQVSYWISANTGEGRAASSITLVLGFALAATMAAGLNARDPRFHPARLATGFLLAMSPFFLFTTTKTVVAALLGVPTLAFSNRPLVPSDGPLRPSTPRVVVVVFDGLDYALPPGSKEFVRLSETSIHWTNAYPRTNATIASLPSIISGRAVTKARPLSANELGFSTAETSTESAWSSSETLFTKAIALGGRSAVIGWYHPYCRLLQSLSACSWYPYEPQPHTLIGILKEEAYLLADTVPFAFRMGLVTRIGAARFSAQNIGTWHAKQYGNIHRDALSAVADPRFNLIFIHYPVPHMPFIAPAVTGDISTGGYEGNVLLADRALGELRAALEKSGLETTTSVVVTADHWNRGPDEGGPIFRPEVGELRHRVVLLLHLPGQASAVAVERPTENVLAHYLALYVLNGKISKPDDVLQTEGSRPPWLLLNGDRRGR